MQSLLFFTGLFYTNVRDVYTIWFFRIKSYKSYTEDRLGTVMGSMVVSIGKVLVSIPGVIKPKNIILVHVAKHTLLRGERSDLLARH
jgi:hypothetical protein